jgi:hypothetical protein
VARHAGESIVRFGLSAFADPAAAIEELGRLPGVRAVTRDRHDVAVHGDRAVIAHIGAWLVNRGEPIPADLRVEVPDLEAALLSLFDHAAPTGEES